MRVLNKAAVVTAVAGLALAGGAAGASASGGKGHPTSNNPGSVLSGTNLPIVTNLPIITCGNPIVIVGVAKGSC